MLIGYVVGLPIGYTTYHQKVTYVLYIEVTTIIGLQNLSLVTYRVGDRKPLENSDFNRVETSFIRSIVEKKPITITTDKWEYSLWLVIEGGRQWRL